jgi:hypothetical protein
MQKRNTCGFLNFVYFGTVLISTLGNSNSVYGQTNSTTNQSSFTTATTNITTKTKAQQEASNSIKGAITEAGQILSNVAQKVTTSKSSGALLKETSHALGNAYVETKKFFNPD